MATRIWHALTPPTKFAYLHCAEHPDPKTLGALQRPALDRLCLLVAAALPIACAAAPTVAPTEPVRAAPRPAATPGVPAGPSAPVSPDSVRFIGPFALSFVPGFADQGVQAERGMRNFVHGLENRFATLLQDDGLVVPDLTVLSIEPVAHSESSGFGWRDDPIRHTRGFHSGTDFRGKPGTPVVAAGDGVVTFCGRMGGYGNMVQIDHGGGVVTRYAHLRRIDTKKDASIAAGVQLGLLGSTGRTTGPHLHFEVRIDGAPVSAITAMSVAALQRESPLAGRLAALALSPELQAATQSDVDPPKQRARSVHGPERPERTGRAKRRQVLW
jgi:murein DD-endopeptidase MepM/ murein hydrolase activator NlpD